jgi:hypothetical protein
MLSLLTVNTFNLEPKYKRPLGRCKCGWQDNRHGTYEGRELKLRPDLFF